MIFVSQFLDGFVVKIRGINAIGLELFVNGFELSHLRIAAYFIGIPEHNVRYVSRKCGRLVRIHQVCLAYIADVRSFFSIVFIDD